MMFESVRCPERPPAKGNIYLVLTTHSINGAYFCEVSKDSRLAQDNVQSYLRRMLCIENIDDYKFELYDPPTKSFKKMNIYKRFNNFSIWRTKYLLINIVPKF